MYEQTHLHVSPFRRTLTTKEVLLRNVEHLADLHQLPLVVSTGESTEVRRTTRRTSRRSRGRYDTQAHSRKNLLPLPGR
jgi:hypothetical protein